MAAIAGLRKEKVRSVILCRDREFKAKSVSFLNGAAFPAEKTTVEDIEDAVDAINRDDLMLNFVIDGSMFSPHDLEKALSRFANVCRNPDVKVLCIIDEAQAEDKERYQAIFKKLFLERPPLRQAQFNRAFHSKKAKRKPNVAAPLQAGDNGLPTEQRKGPALTLIETSVHIKDTITMINDIAKDRSNLQQVIDIGQRFNGLIGAFHFFGNKEGYPKLRHLAEIIDAIGRTYEGTDRTEIDSTHYQILVDAAKCSYLILKDMRDGQGVRPDRLASHDELAERFEALEGIKIRANENQEDIDRMLDEQLKESS
ncbi:hypothetical protein [Pseudobacteriovorax antillogorgiicola]|uniref:Uncharacterized protein n=1 Tax=Pseudobacteriovorax antillogorgiicola TaxID=1513793 RepID=A0A1Y6C9S5_9BACT|nr:hypothetical protein [Pseudobacteriovorax antillogorgiicola]TCS51721.1 hypothetical protein EDD56_110106 [Pseudobacteriovorax antillogorgiicola]SMF49433.1 hypothetical protein SAMN06296036_11575 [Pseudobacteriovorax antillogorgiicola]